MATLTETYKVAFAHEEALREANKAAQAFADQHFNGGDGGACGFAWVDVYGVRSNSKLGKALQEVGFRKSYSGQLQLWNGRNGWYFGQSVDASEAGAIAYANKFKELLGLDRCYAGSRLD
mgnify:CR=1 FL=1